LECRNVPGSALTLPTLGADLGALYQAALAPATQFEDLAQATQGVAVQAPATGSGSRPAPVLALGFDNALPQQATPNVLSQGLSGAQPLALPGGQAAAGTDVLSQAVQTFVGAGRGSLGSPKAGLGGQGAPPLPPAQVVADPTFSAGLPSYAWTVGNTNDPYVYQSFGGLGSEAVLGTVGGVNTLTQVSIYTSAAYYNISFDWANDDTSGGPSQLAVEWNGAEVFNVVNPGPTGYTHFDSGAVYTGPYYSTLTIVERNDPSYFHITNVQANG
jgi:hypothetical protein